MATGTIVTFEEFEQLEFGADDVELLKGEIIRLPPSIRSHMAICRSLFLKLTAAVERVRGASSHLHLGNVCIEEGYLLSTEPRSWLKPDVSLTHPDQAGDRYYLGAPLIVFEIISDSDRPANIERKITEYLNNGAAEVWVIYPKKRNARVHELSGKNRLETEAVRTPLLPGVEIAFSEIF